MAVVDVYGTFNPKRQAGAQHVLADSGYHRFDVMVATQDRCQIPSGAEVGSKVYLAPVSWDFIPIRELSTVNFDDAGTSVTLNFGDANDVDALIALQDIAAAAGSCSAIKTIDISREGDPLWKLLGYASRDAAVTANAGLQTASLFFTIAGATTGAACDLAWKLVGTRA